jgi:hypothetical protein
MPISARILFGQAGADAGPGAQLWLQSDAADDGGVAYQFRALSNWNAPQGAGGECIFPMLYLTVTWTKEGTLQITPLVDNKGTSRAVVAGSTMEVRVQELELPAIAGERRTETFEIPLVEDWMIGGNPFSTKSVRGTRLRVLIESTDLESGDLIIDGVEVEYEPVRESKVMG